MLWNRVSFKYQNINKQINALNKQTRITERIFAEKMKDVLFMLCLCLMLITN